MPRPQSLRLSVLAGLIALRVAVACRALVAAEPPSFSRDILPILSDNCFQCHGPDAKAREADLRLDQQDSALRTEKPIIVPGKSGDSELMKRLRSTDPDTVMPPPKSARKLTPAQIELISAWINGGANWGKHWAFEKPIRPELPNLKSEISNLKSRIKNPIDAFIVARLEREGLTPSPEASKHTLLRRVTLDLTGLPPTLDELDAFLADQSSDAYEQVVDRLLKSPRFGERMVWEWLDAARYADTNGYQGDPTRTMYFWRDWVIDAFNKNMPFDQFTIEQLAGDLLPNPTPEQLIATGFHRNHMINGEGGRIAEESRVDYVQDRVETTGTVWLGLTLNCCRCHDHKFDPFTQREYYQLSAYFNSIEESGANDAGGLANPVITLATPDGQQKIAEAKAREIAAIKDRSDAENKVRDSHNDWLKKLRTDFSGANQDAAKLALPDKIRELLAIEPDKLNDAPKKELLDFHLNSDETVAAARKKADEAKKAREGVERAQPRTMVMRERGQPRDTFILIRGAYDKFGDKVWHGTPAVLPPLPDDGANNRLAIARWLMSPDHPLTARVTVNRYWQLFFGTGLVKTTEDFGIQGERPSHPELLDWLASEFLESREPRVESREQDKQLAEQLANPRWNVKRLIRLIVTSATYRQESRVQRRETRVQQDAELSTLNSRLSAIPKTACSHVARAIDCRAG